MCFNKEIKLSVQNVAHFVIDALYYLVQSGGVMAIQDLKMDTNLYC